MRGRPTGSRPRKQDQLNVCPSSLGVVVVHMRPLRGRAGIARAPLLLVTGCLVLLPTPRTMVRAHVTAAHGSRQRYVGRVRTSARRARSTAGQSNA